MTWRARAWVVTVVVTLQLAAPWAEEERRTSPDNPDPYGPPRLAPPNQLLSVLPTFSLPDRRRSCPDAFGNYDPGNCHG